jgi:hypothetical protein
MSAVAASAPEDGCKDHKKSRWAEQRRYVIRIKAETDADLYKIPILRRPPASRIHMLCVTRLPLRHARSIAMMDAIVLVIGFAFFALSIGYVYACDRL